MLLKIFYELGLRLKQLYFYNLSIECNKKSDLNLDNSNSFLKGWRGENKDFVKYFDDELFCIMLSSFLVLLLLLNLANG